MFVWMDISGAGRSAVALPDPSFCSTKLPIEIVPQLFSNLVNGPKGTQPVPSTPSSCTVQHKKGLEVILKISEIGYILPGFVGLVVSIDNRTSKAVEGILFVLEEIVTVKFGEKPVVYRHVIVQDRPNAPVFVDKHTQGLSVFSFFFFFFVFFLPGVVKHSVEVTPPRGNESGVSNYSFDSPFLSIAHRLICYPVIKG
jgi:hypothetical protein